MNVRPPLWAPVTTPIEAGSGRRYLRPKPFTLALALMATLSAVLFFLTQSAPQLAVSGAVWVAIVVDAVVARRSLRDVRIEISSEALLTTADPMRCWVHVQGARRPVVLTPAVRPSVQHFLLEGDEPGMIVLAPRWRGVVHSLTIDLTASGPIGLMECGRRLRVPLDRSVTVGPAMVPHVIDWPRPRAVHFGSIESTPIGDDLSRTVRPYVRGDSRRRVHWKATAHHGSLMVKENDGTGVVSVRMAVQLDTPGAAAEVALSRAAWTACEVLARGWRLELVTRQPHDSFAADAPRLGSPFLPPPLELLASYGPAEVRSRRVDREQAVLSTLATAVYGPIDLPTTPGLTYLVTNNGDRWL